MVLLYQPTALASGSVVEVVFPTQVILDCCNSVFYDCFDIAVVFKHINYFSISLFLPLRAHPA